MSNRAIQKRIKLGYAVYINRTGSKGLKAWERVGYLFNTGYEASQYREKYFSTITKWSVQAVRLKAEHEGAKNEI